MGSPEESPQLASNENAEAMFSDNASTLFDMKEIERLGRIRPECFKTLWSEIGFVLSICMAQILVEYYVSGFNVLVPVIIDALDIPPESSTWPASSFSLVIACFLLPMGRFSDMYGGKRLFILGVGWLVIFSIVGGIAKNQLMLVFARALAGLGPAAFLPSSVMLLGSVYRPGPRKNLLALVFFHWCHLDRDFFFLAWASMPDDRDERASFGMKMDWPGAAMIVSGLILVVFSFTASPGAPQGWRTPYIPVAFCLGLVTLGIAVWWEGWMAEQPLLPIEIFKVKMFPAVVGAMFMQYGGLGIFLLYTTYYMDTILGGSPLKIVAWFSPMCVGGIIIAAAGGFVLHILSGTILMLIAGVSWIVAPLLFAIMPENASYWAFVFPAMVTGTIGIDVSFNITNIFITTGLPKRQQGLAGAIINSNMHLSIAFFLGLAEILAHETRHAGKRRSYEYVFWFEVGLASIALLIMLVFVRLDKAKSDLTADEKERLRKQEEANGSSTTIESQ
ncbi:Similar to Uncharacterized MFS-type transporter C1683.03c; acc. no. Q9P6J7 [Pyronema omphalodes CBS 100304]|uniref:Similar to Uncharacterized MFS-type transporter C1683.03c acc. no. Q9P6J7 n=1 Tax=Pyronema omphalodes (strain CBS 100304) TaxID=1076935 RepID=U4L861_PYROM|nr:Similar to Uncharacterized MFS-type transporter C1683.03c; acc. no. Q9P6J7 [Pyronema omphalodes CBS 100304]